MNGVIETLVEYFRDLSEQHPDVNGYMTGEHYDNNLDYQVYPVVWLQYPVYGELTEDYVFANLILGVYTNSLKDEFDNDVQQSEATTQRTTNQINYNQLLPSDAMMERCMRIATNFFVKLKQDGDVNKVPVIVLSSSYSTKSRVYNDDVTGIELSIKIKFDNPYKCEVEDIFSI